MEWSTGGLAMLSMGTGLCQTSAVLAVLAVLVELAEALFASPMTSPETEATTTSTARVAVRMGLNQVCFLMQHTMRRKFWARKNYSCFSSASLTTLVGTVDLGQEPRESTSSTPLYGAVVATRPTTGAFNGFPPIEP